MKKFKKCIDNLRRVRVGCRGYRRRPKHDHSAAIASSLWRNDQVLMTARSDFETPDPGAGCSGTQSLDQTGCTHSTIYLLRQGRSPVEHVTTCPPAVSLSSNRTRCLRVEGTRKTGLSGSLLPAPNARV